jgi:hypothetical protein
MWGCHSSGQWPVDRNLTSGQLSVVSGQLSKALGERRWLAPLIEWLSSTERLSQDDTAPSIYVIARIIRVHDSCRKIRYNPICGRPGGINASG